MAGKESPQGYGACRLFGDNREIMDQLAKRQRGQKGLPRDQKNLSEFPALRESFGLLEERTCLQRQIRKEENFYFCSVCLS